jgi:hypothetical protein
MSGTAANSSIWTMLLPVIVGALIGLVGGFVGPFLVQWRKDASRKVVGKFEELVAALYEFDHWVEELRGRIVYDRDIVMIVSPFAKLQAISLVYFPRFIQAIHELGEVTGTYSRWMRGAAQRRLDGDIDNVGVGFHEAREPYVEKREQLLKEFNSPGDHTHTSTASPAAGLSFPADPKANGARRRRIYARPPT